jgi:hypothetical protein
MKINKLVITIMFISLSACGFFKGARDQTSSVGATINNQSSQDVTLKLWLHEESVSNNCESFPSKSYMIAAGKQETHELSVRCEDASAYERASVEIPYSEDIQRVNLLIDSRDLKSIPSNGQNIGIRFTSGEIRGIAIASQSFHRIFYPELKSGDTFTIPNITTIMATLPLGYALNYIYLGNSTETVQAFVLAKNLFKTRPSSVVAEDDSNYEIAPFIENSKGPNIISIHLEGKYDGNYEVEVTDESVTLQ